MSSLSKNDLENKVKELEFELAQLKQRQPVNCLTGLADLETRIQEVQEIGRFGDWEVDLKTGAVYWSKELYKILMIDFDTELDLTNVLTKLVHPDDVELAQKALKTGVKTGIIDPFEFRVIRSDGSIRTIWCKGRAIYDETGAPIKIFGIDQDVTERKNVEESLEKARIKAEESDALKTAFLENISHEVRTPMNSILGFSEMLNRSTTEGATAEYLPLIQASGKRLLGIISNIIDISMLDTHQLELEYTQCNVNEIIDDLENELNSLMVTDAISVSTEKSLSNNEAIILTDGGRLNRILWNLIDNSLKSTQSGSITFGYTIDEKVLSFFVKDSGAGISQIDQNSIFKKFHQVRRDADSESSGTGLGLAVVQKMVELLSGSVCCKSEVGVGSTFTVSIPYTRPIKSIIPENESIDSLAGVHGVKSILIVDDEELNCMFLEAVIEEALDEGNYKIQCVHNGKDAVNTILNDQNIDLVLMDIKMPIMGGLEATREIRKFNQNIPIVAQTAYTLNEDKARALSAGCCDYLSKPVSVKDLNLMLKKHLST